MDFAIFKSTRHATVEYSCVIFPRLYPRLCALCAMDAGRSHSRGKIGIIIDNSIAEGVVKADLPVHVNTTKKRTTTQSQLGRKLYCADATCKARDESGEPLAGQSRIMRS